jgi:diaminopimelate decarboxylase
MLTAAIEAPKISFATFAMNSLSASRQTKRCCCYVTYAQKIGLHCRKFHHALGHSTQPTYALRARRVRIAANVAKLAELLRKS